LARKICPESHLQFASDFSDQIFLLINVNIAHHPIMRDVVIDWQEKSGPKFICDLLQFARFTVSHKNRAISRIEKQLDRSPALSGLTGQALSSQVYDYL